MFKRYHEPLGNYEGRQDPLPINWREISESAPHFPDALATVTRRKLYRSAIIWPKQIPFLQEKYGIKHIVSLISGDWLE